MSILSTISEALHLYGKSINREAVTNVTFKFRNNLTDIPSMFPTWEVTIKLVGNTAVSLEKVDELFSQEFKGEAGSEELALKAAYDEIKGRVAAFLRAREEETAFAQQAMLTVASDDQVALSALWASSEAPVEGQAEGP